MDENRKEKAYCSDQLINDLKPTVKPKPKQQSSETKEEK